MDAITNTIEMSLTTTWSKIIRNGMFENIPAAL